MKNRWLRAVFVLLIGILPIGCESPSETATPDTPGAEPPIQIPATAKYPAQVVLASVTSPDLAISGTGAVENTVVTYEVRDSLGAPVGEGIPMYFSFEFYPNTFTMVGTAPRLMPPSGSTDVAGRVSVTVLSGTQAGVVQLSARIPLGTRTISSAPVRITVHAGFPDQAHFTLAAAQYNFPGLEINYVSDKITVLVGDKFSNPVVAGTAVLFNTSHGVITTGDGLAGLTDDDGFVSKFLYSANPRPEGSIAYYGSGFSYVYARTKGEGGAEILDSIRILWSGAPILIEDLANPGSYVIPNGGTAGPWNFQIVDRYGHPVSEGMTINITGEALKFFGNAVDFRMPDTQSNGPGLTDFSFTASDADALTASIPPAPSAITITITHPVYRGIKAVLARGTVQ